MLRGMRRSDMKSRMTPRRLSRVDWVMAWIVRIGKILIVSVLVVWLALWLWADGWLKRTEDWLRNYVAQGTAEAGLKIGNVDIVGRNNLPLADIKAAIGVEKGAPLLGVDLDLVQARLQKNPWVRDVTIRRALPDRLVITITERQPVAIWLDADGGPGIVDADGVVLRQSGFENFGPLLAVTGKDAEKKASALIALLKGQPDVAVRIKRAVFVSQRRWDLVVDQDTVVKLPGDDAGLALARLAKAQADTKIMDQGLKSIDLRQADRLILENRPGDIRDLLVKDGNPV